MNLRTAITAAAAVADAKATLPILTTVRIGGGQVSACDMEAQIDIPVALPKEIAKQSFCVHAKRLTRVLAALPEEDELKIKLNKDGTRCLISAGHTRYELLTLPAAAFVTLNDDAEGAPVLIDLPAKDLVAALRFVAPAMAAQDVRYYLNGLHLFTKPGSVTFTATDGHRLHRARAEIEAHPDTATAACIIPRNAVARLIELADGHPDAHLALTKNSLTAECHATLRTKLIDGAFPDSERVIPAKRPAHVSIDRKAMSEAVKRVAQIFSGDKFTGVRLTSGSVGELNEHAILIDAQTQLGETASAAVECARPDQGKLKLDSGFDWQYLRDALDAFSTDRVNLHLPDDPAGALYLTDGDAGAQCAVIMPMRV